MDSKILDSVNLILSKLARFILWALGISVFVWAYFDPRFRNTEGFLQGQFCLPIAVGGALLILGWAITKQINRFALWLCLGLTGQAVALQMIEAGPYVRYQHYKPFLRILIESHPLLLIFLVVQVALVGTGLRRRWSTIRSWLAHNFKIYQLLGVGLVFFLASATVSRNLPHYAFELLFATFVQAVNLGNVVLMVWALPEKALVWLRKKSEKFIGPLSKKDERRQRGLDQYVVLAAIWIVVIATFLNVFVYQRHPHIPDEVLYLYQARYMAGGMLTVPAPPVPEAFSFYMIPYEAGRWYSIFPPGWPALLAVGVLVGVPWLINPLLAGLNVLLAFLFLRELYSDRIARIGVLLLCFSPWYIFMAMNFMSHTFTLTCALIAAIAVAQIRRSGKAIWGCLGGIAIGILGLIRPLDGVIVAGLLGLWAIGFGGRRLKFSSITAFVVSAILISAFILPYNKRITGDPTVFPLVAYYDKYFGPKVNALGFGPERGLGWAIDPFPGHSPLEAIINANLNTFAINVELLGWSTGSLLILTLFLFSGAMQRSDYLMLAAIIAIFCTYSLYWFSGGPDFGARYWYLMLVPLVALTARGIQVLERMLPSGTGGSSSKGTLVMVAVLSLSLIGFINYFPWRAIDKYHHYRGMRPDIRKLAKEYHFGKSLVFIRNKPGIPSDYLSAWTYNPLDPYANAPIYVRNTHPELRALLLEAYPDRPVWIVNGPTLTNAGYKIVDGPLARFELLEKSMK